MLELMRVPEAKIQFSEPQNLLDKQDLTDVQHSFVP